MISLMAKLRIPTPLIAGLLSLLLVVAPAWPQAAEPAPAEPSPPAPAVVETSPAPSAPSTPAPAATTLPPVGSGETLVTNSFFDTDLRQALSDVALQAGVTIMMDDSVSGFLTLELRGIPLERALRLMLLQGGYVYAEVEPGVYVVTAPDPKAPSYRLVAVTQVVPLVNASADSLAALLPERFKPFVKFDAVGNRAIVEAPRQLLEEVVAYLKSLDLRRGQVMIEAVVLETTEGTMQQYLPTFASGNFAGDIAGGILRYATSAGQLATGPQPPADTNVLIDLRWLLENSRAVLRANPRIVALDGEQAEVEVGTQQYFSILTGSAAYAYTQLERIDATIKLTIKARVIQETGEIVCEIEPNVSDAAGTGTGGLPVITVRRAKSTVRIRDGEAIVIGGLLQDFESRQESRIPLLSDIPLLGQLFRSTKHTTATREIVILISPHILDGDGRFQGPSLAQLLLGHDPQSPLGVTAPPATPAGTVPPTPTETTPPRRPSSRARSSSPGP